MTVCSSTAKLYMIGRVLKFIFFKQIKLIMIISIIIIRRPGLGSYTSIIIMLKILDYYYSDGNKPGDKKKCTKCSYCSRTEQAPED